MKHKRSERASETNLRPGWFLSWQGMTYHVLPRESTDPLDIDVVDVGTGEHIVLRVEDLFQAGDDEQSSLVAAPSHEALQAAIARQSPLSAPSASTDLPEALLKRADVLIATVEAVEATIADDERRAFAQGADFKRTAAVQRACALLDEPLGVATFYKYRGIYNKYGGNRTQIAVSFRRSTYNQSKMSKAQLHFVDTLVMRYYARSRPMRPLTLYRVARSTLDRTQGLWLDPSRCGKHVPQNVVEDLLNPKLPMQAILSNQETVRLLTRISAPSKSWLYQYLRWFSAQPGDGKDVIVKRHGKNAWEDERMVFDTFVTRATLPLQYVFADHWLLDVFTVDEETRSKIDRLWLTVLIDAYSRSILGMALLYESPCIESIQSALKHAIWPKTSHTEMGLDAPWATFGIPLELFLDNAWAHHSHSLEDLARSISQGGIYNSITLNMRPPYKGRYGALIERFFGNLSAQMKEQLRGAIKSSNYLDVRNAAREACLLYQDVNRIIHQLVLAYQHTPHSELGGMTPHEKWTEGIQSGLPLVPPARPATDRLFWRMSPNTRVISANGVSAFGMHYWSPELAGIQRVGKDGKPTQYGFRYEPSNISRIALFRDGTWVGDALAKELRLPDGSTMPVSLWERAIAAELAKSNGRVAHDWLSHINDVDGIVNRRQLERRQVQQKAKRGIGQRPVKPDVHATEKAVADVQPQEHNDMYTTLLADFMDRE